MFLLNYLKNVNIPQCQQKDKNTLYFEEKKKGVDTWGLVQPPHQVLGVVKPPLVFYFYFFKKKKIEFI
jgi:hypothetical protein